MKRRQHVGVHRVACRGPSDLSGVQALIESGKLLPGDIVAVMGKTEGNGCVNDYTRDFASSSWCRFLSPYLGCSPDAVAQRVALVMSGGTEGVLSPHFTVFTRSWTDDASPGTGEVAPRLVLGIAHTRVFLPEEIGRMAQVEATAAAVRVAMQDAGIANVDDVHFVQVKCPLLTAAKMQSVVARSASLVTHDTYESMSYSRAASSLGVAVGLNELPPGRIFDHVIGTDRTLYSARASASAGIELDGNVVIVLGEAAGASSPYRIGHAVMRDAVDAASVRQLLRERFGLDADADAEAMRRRLVNVLAKAEASPDGCVRGERHTMLDDSDINATRHARAAVGAVLASVVGQSALYVSGGAEHQGPAGGGPVAVIMRTEDRFET
jgi:cyanuric acid amidohydrolase